MVQKARRCRLRVTKRSSILLVISHTQSYHNTLTSSSLLSILRLLDHPAGRQDMGRQARQGIRSNEDSRGVDDEMRSRSKTHVPNYVKKTNNAPENASKRDSTGRSEREVQGVWAKKRKTRPTSTTSTRTRTHYSTILTHTHS